MPLFPASRPATAGPALGLRWYQEEALDAVQRRYDAGVTKMVLSLPTGSGKTITASHVIKRFGQFGRAVFLVHRDELAEQTVRAMHAVLPQHTIGVCKAERDELNADVIVASVQTVSRPKRLERLRSYVGTGNILVCDEMHHAAATTWRAVIEGMSPGLLIGLSATPKRHDGVGMDDIFDEVVYHLPMRLLVEEGHLARPVGLRINTEVDIDNVHTRGGDFVDSELSTTVDTPERNALVVAAWAKHAGDRMRTLAFCSSVHHAYALRDAFLAVGISAAAVDGAMDTDLRRRIFADFHDGKYDVLANCQICVEGYDEPAIDCVLMAKPTKSQSLYIQMVGRGLRKYANKQDCLIVDFVDNTMKHKLVTLPTLSGLEAKEAKLTGKAGAGSEDLATIEEEDRKPGQFMDLFDAMKHKGKLREREAISIDLLDGSSIHWRPMPGDRFVASIETGWVTIIPEGDGFVPVKVSKESGMTRLWNEPMDVAMAMSVAEASIPRNALTSKDSGWRRRPASLKQLAAAERWRITPPKNVSAGQLSDLIDAKAFESTMRRLSPRSLIR